jgi:hypothetical protein
MADAMITIDTPKPLNIARTPFCSQNIR